MALCRVEWYSDGTNCGYVAAMNNLGVCYEKCQGSAICRSIAVQSCKKRSSSNRLQEKKEVL